MLSMSHMYVRSTDPFDIVHVDLWGSSLVIFVNNMICFLLFVDYYTRYQYIYVLSDKT